MKLKHHPRDGIVEIEGDPVELAHYTHELEKRRAHEGEPSIELKQPTESYSIHEKVKNVDSRAIAEYIYSLGKPDMAHSIRELMMHFLGEVIPSKRQQNAYLNFYAKVTRAHSVIGSEKNGLWTGDKNRGQDGRSYVVYKFIQK